MKHLIITTALALCSICAIAQKLPDTSRAPRVYWSELIRLQNINNELTRRIHRLDMPALKRDTLDMYSSTIGELVPLVYGRVYRDSVKKAKK